MVTLRVPQASVKRRPSQVVMPENAMQQPTAACSAPCRGSGTLAMVRSVNHASVPRAEPLDTADGAGREGLRGGVEHQTQERALTARGAAWGESGELGQQEAGKEPGGVLVELLGQVDAYT
ncbi:hypothetical protein Sm713_50430 [Streptomyces sp. TS71-3]|nr:hypothetical protein Sm713_50430 [Streptomyces sp. TS71-3]